MRERITRITRAAHAILAALLLATLLLSGGASNAWAATRGTVVAWGNNGYGQGSVPNDLGNVIAIAAGGNHSLALTRGTD